MVSSATLSRPSSVTSGISSRSIKNVASSVFKLGVGEVVSNFASFLLFAYISRHFGVELLGTVALAQTVARYVTLGTDQGLRLVGARLVARNGGAAPLIIKAVLLKRLLSCGVCVAMGSAYALFGPVPHDARLYILGFVLAVVPYAFSLDWLAWGLDKFAWLGTFRAGVTVLFLLTAVSGIIFTKTTLLPITVGNGLAATGGALSLWAVWRLQWKAEVRTGVPAPRDLVERELGWFTILPLGLTTILNQAFHCFDTVLLAAKSTASQLGRYSAAYKVLFVVLGAYWLLTNSLYPKLSRAKAEPEARKLLLRSLLVVTTAGIFLAVVVGILAPRILTMIYGNDLGATTLLRILVFAIPMDFCVALLTVVFVSRKLDGPILAAIGSAAVMNVVLNLYLIPKFQANGAAVATLVSYIYLLAFLLQHTIRKPVFAAEIISAASNAS